jgi:hypothetical protein
MDYQRNAVYFTPRPAGLVSGPAPERRSMLMSKLPWLMTIVGFVIAVAASPGDSAQTDEASPTETLAIIVFMIGVGWLLARWLRRRFGRRRGQAQATRAQVKEWKKLSKQQQQQFRDYEQRQLAAGMTGPALDAERDQYTANVKQRALEVLTLDESEVSTVDPVVVRGYWVHGPHLTKQCEDGLYRSPDAFAMVLFFDDDQLYHYQIDFSLTDPNRRPSEQSNDYFYRDVISVQVNDDSFKLTTSAGGVVEFPVFDQASLASLRGARTLITAKKRSV